MTVEANVAFGLAVRRVPRRERRRRVAEALALVHMGACAHRKPNQLSGGQQQRVALARALVIRPQCLLLDEPLSNLDAKLRLEMRGEIRRLCKDAGLTAIYVTHDQKEALSVADRMAVMFAGRIAQVGTPEELYRRPADGRVADFLGETNFLAATIRERRPDGMTLHTELGELVAADPGAAGLPGDGTASFRPEAVVIVDDDAGGASETNRWTGQIVARTYLGDMLQLTLAVGSARLRVSVVESAGRRPLNIGDVVTWRIDPADVVILPSVHAQAPAE